MADTEKVIKELEQYICYKQDICSDGFCKENKCSVNNAIQTIRELQEQIPKWHYCKDEFPKESGYYLVAYHEWSNGDFLPKYDDTRVRTMHFQNSERYVGWNYPVCCDERAEEDTYREVIAWMELPKFSEVE